MKFENRKRSINKSIIEADADSPSFIEPDFGWNREDVSTTVHVPKNTALSPTSKNDPSPTTVKDLSPSSKDEVSPRPKVLSPTKKDEVNLSPNRLKVTSPNNKDVVSPGLKDDKSEKSLKSKRTNKTFDSKKYETALFRHYEKALDHQDGDVGLVE